MINAPSVSAGGALLFEKKHLEKVENYIA